MTGCVGSNDYSRSDSSGISKIGFGIHVFHIRVYFQVAIQQNWINVKAKRIPLHFGRLQNTFLVRISIGEPEWNFLN